LHVLIVALDYARTNRPVTYTTTARNVEELARQCGVHWLTTLYDEDATRSALSAALKQMTARCGPDDVFVFYFAGHGAVSGDTPDSGDAFVLVDQNGKVSAKTLVPSDEVARAVLEGCHPDTRVVFLVDTCYNSSILDLGREGWDRRQAVLIAGTLDERCSSEQEDSGGIFSHILLLAIDKLSKVGRENYSAGMLFNAALHENDLVFRSKQDLTIQTPARFLSDAMAWPLVPPAGYQAPLNRCATATGLRSDSAALGVPSVMLQFVRKESLNVPVSVEEYVSQVQGASLFGLKGNRACQAGCSTGDCTVQ